MNALRSKLAEGRLLGVIQTMPSAEVSEVLAAAGLDMLMLDLEHGLSGMGDLLNQLRALQGTGVPALVRVPRADAAFVNRLQDAGVDTLLFPAVQSAEEARALVRACRYPPAGTRGAGGGLRASRYDRDPHYYANAQANTVIGVQIESARGVEEAARICAVEGIDLVVIGPRDLSASVGKLGRFDDPEVLALYEQAEQAIAASGVAMGSTLYPGRSVAQMFARGHRLLLVGTDVGLLGRAARGWVEGPRA